MLGTTTNPGSATDLLTADLLTADLITADDVVDLVRTLPTWDPQLDDDPNWLRPVGAAGLTRLRLEDESDAYRIYRDAVQAIDAELPALAQVPTELVLYTGQQWLRIDALAHYLAAEDDREVRWPNAPAGARTLFDPEGWHGNDHPVLFWYEDGYCVLDGNNRCGASRLAGRETITAHVLVGPSAQ